jgi:hypothetical protein
LNEEDGFEGSARATLARLSMDDGALPRVYDPVHDHLEPWRLQENVIVVAACFVELEHVGIERGDLVEPFREQHCACP